MGPANRGRVGNTGFVVGPRGVLVIDAGVSRRQGEALLGEIARVTSQPVRRLLLTHARQEFLFGAGAFAARGIPVAMPREAARLMAARCEGCLKTLRRTLGDEEMADTVLPVPDAVFDTPDAAALARESQRLSEEIGRPLRLLHFGHSSGPGDVALWDPDSGVLFAGGLLDRQHVPDVQDSRLADWRAALARLQALPLRRIVPGHGPLGDATLVAEVGRYLDALQSQVQALLDRGAALSEVPDLAELPQYRRWDQYEVVHRRNASVVFLRLEAEQLFRQ
ncbi:MBL fold metallo-hydrolase [Piscinibacter sakaiensis]|uniref:MBL fold metallo-hydrolase n=1 Tax=Piscinibacter sakaiensis TaxID=1547922 RepID=UPI00372A4E71